MRPSSTVQSHRVGLSPTVLAVAFVTGFLAVPIFHQIAFLLLYLAGVLPVPPYDLRATAPLGVPAVLSASFWGGVWGIVFMLIVPRWFHGPACWAASFVFGAVALTLVYAFVVVPLKIGALPADLLSLLIIGGLLNGAWGIGTALLLRLFDRLIGATSATA